MKKDEVLLRLTILSNSLLPEYSAKLRTKYPNLPVNYKSLWNISEKKSHSVALPEFGFCTFRKASLLIPLVFQF